MASPPNSKTLSLCFLFYVLLLFMHDSSARDIKKQDEFDPYSGYLGGYNLKKQIHLSQHEDSKHDSSERDVKKREEFDPYSGYLGGYNLKKHIHLSQHEDSKHGSSEKDVKKQEEFDPYSGYLGGYNLKNHVHLSQNEDSNHGSSAKDVKKQEEFDPYSGYLGGYNLKNHIHLSQNEDSKHGSSAKEVKKQEEFDPYSGYNLKNHIHLSQNEDSKHGSSAKDVKKQEEFDPYSGYLGGYNLKKHIHLSQHEDSKHGSSAKYVKKQEEFDPYSGYLGGYNLKKHIHLSQQEDSKSSQKNQSVNQPYITVYGNSNNSKVSTQDSKDSYSARYKKTEQDSYGKNPNDSYAATYGKDSKDSHAATYKKDHTKAFRIGFFTLDDLYVGNRMTLQFPIKDFPQFLLKKEADTIPFSMSQLPSLLQLFSVSEDSHQAQAMRDTLEQCEYKPLTGETKSCVTSLESMTDFVHGIIGSESRLDILTTTLPTTSSVPLQNHTILEISQDIYAPKWVACHPMPYPYAIFYCHFIGTGSRIFKVQLGMENGEKVEALGMCHLDTSEWSPDYILFQLLGIKAGEAPMCHFFPVKHFLWVPLPSN